MFRYEKFVGTLELLIITKYEQNEGGGFFCSEIAVFIENSLHNLILYLSLPLKNYRYINKPNN